MIRHILFISVLLLITTVLTSCESGREAAPRPRIVLELDAGWSLREAGMGDRHPATVPGCVHTDLLAAGLIPDPFFGENEKDLQWIGEREWVYSCDFTASDSLLGHENISIEFDGLDTYAEISLNGVRLFNADNMFREWSADIKQHLRPGENSLEVRFLPTGPIETARHDSLGYDLPGGSRVFTRKAAYHYGWDWGPRFLTCGIWRPVRITGWSGAAISVTDIRVTEIGGDAATVRIKVFLSSEKACRAEVILRDGVGTERCSAEVELQGKEGNTEFWLLGGGGRAELELRIDDLELWYPAGLGEQPLQRFIVELYVHAMLVDSHDLSFGIRTIELVTEEDNAGETFYFKVNGIPTFIKGANWIPMDSFLPRSSPADYRRLLTAAKNANMNMLRVWGGGIYENDIFYDLCDSLGIMVWQDLMYACAMYPGDTLFFMNAGAGIADNMLRLSGHPCISLWCGNNENDEGWRNWGWQDGYSGEQKADIRLAYDRMFDNFMPSVIGLSYSFGNVSSSSYHPSSPRFGRADPRSLTEGDAHYWGVWHDDEPFEVLEEKVPRFMSEFGFQSLPSMKTIEAFTEPGGRHLDSAAMLSHQKHPRGYDLIREYMERWFRVPEGFEDYVYVSQLLQAEGMRIGFEAQRRAMPYCMGTLYWQLNDCWPAISWSSIDYGGQWKALHYAAKRAFEPVLISTAVEDGSIVVYIVSDRLEELGGWVTMKAALFDGTEVWERVINVKAPANGSLEIFSIPLDILLAGADRSAVVFSAVFDCPGENPTRAIRYFAHPKDLKLPATEIEFDIFEDRGGVVLELRSAVLAKNVFLQFDGNGDSSGSVHFSDNFFDLLPGETVSVTVKTAVPADEIKDRIRIKTLRDTY